MINLLPPAIKEEIAYSKRNAVMRNYVILVVTITIMLAGLLLGTRYYLNSQIAAKQQDLDTKQAQIDKYTTVENKAAALNSRLATIKSIQTSQSKFSVLLSDLAKYMPVGTALTSITLTGNARLPVQVTVVANGYATALSFRDSIIRSKRISAADIESIAPVTAGPGSFAITAVFAFNPGEAQ